MYPARPPLRKIIQDLLINYNPLSLPIAGFGVEYNPEDVGQPTPGILCEADYIDENNKRTQQDC